MDLVADNLATQADTVLVLGQYIVLRGYETAVQLVQHWNNVAEHVDVLDKQWVLVAELVVREDMEENSVFPDLVATVGLAVVEPMENVVTQAALGQDFVVVGQVL